MAHDTQEFLFKYCDSINLQDLQHPLASVVSVPWRRQTHVMLCVRQYVVRQGVSIVDACYTHRFTVQGVEGRTRGLGLFGNKQSINIFTGVLHTLVMRGYISVVNLYEQEEQKLGQIFNKHVILGSYTNTTWPKHLLISGVCQELTPSNVIKILIGSGIKFDFSMVF